MSIKPKCWKFYHAKVVSCRPTLSSYVACVDPQSSTKPQLAAAKHNREHLANRSRLIGTQSISVCCGYAKIGSYSSTTRKALPQRATAPVEELIRTEVFTHPISESHRGSWQQLPRNWMPDNFTMLIQTITPVISQSEFRNGFKGVSPILLVSPEKLISRASIGIPQIASSKS
jgi:hypothetical protein